MGLLRRGFSPEDTMMAVYDWAGSQTPEPEHFELQTNNAKCFFPARSVTPADRPMLFMGECDAPLPSEGFGKFRNCRQLQFKI